MKRQCSLILHPHLHQIPNLSLNSPLTRDLLLNDLVGLLIRVVLKPPMPKVHGLFEVAHAGGEAGGEDGEEVGGHVDAAI